MAEIIEFPRDDESLNEKLKPLTAAITNAILALYEDPKFENYLPRDFAMSALDAAALCWFGLHGGPKAPKLAKDWFRACYDHYAKGGTIYGEPPDDEN